MFMTLPAGHQGFVNNDEVFIDLCYAVDWIISFAYSVHEDNLNYFISYHIHSNHSKTSILNFIVNN